MFKIKANPTFVATAKIPAAGGDILELKWVFKHRTRKQLEAFLQEAAKAEMSDVDGILDMVEGWEEVDTPFSREAVEELLDQYHDVVRPTMDAYLQGINGAKQGN